MFIAPIDINFFNMATLKNRFQDAYNNSESWMSKNDPRNETGKKGSILLGGHDYGTNWTAQDQAQYDLYLKSLEFDNNVDLINYMNQYNSPSAQVQRMHQAGLNPDLQNIDNTPASGENVQSPSAPTGSNETTSDKVLKYAGVAQQFFELIPQALQLYQSIHGGFQQLSSNDLDLIGKADAIAQNEIGKQLTVDDLNDISSIPTLSYSHLPIRQQRRIEKQVNSYLTDFRRRDAAKSFVYKSKYLGETSRQDYLNLLGKHGFSFDDDAFVTVIKEFNNALDKSRKAEANYNSSYYSNRDGSQKASVENKIDSKRGKEAENDIYVDLMSKANRLIDSDTNKDKIAGTIMYILLGLMKSQTGGAIQ